MKTFAVILLMAAVLLTSHAAQAAQTSLELVLSDDQVVFNTSTNISMQMIFRNVGATNLSPAQLMTDLTVVLDGKEFKRDRLLMPSLNILVYFEPRRGWRTHFSFSEFHIPPKALASGRHTITLRDMGVKSNTQTIFIEP